MRVQIPPELLFEIGLGIISENHSERLSEIQLQAESRWSFKVLLRVCFDFNQISNLQYFGFYLHLHCEIDT